MIIDSHCHLDLLAKHFDIECLVAECKQDGVDYLLNIATSPQNFDATLEFAQRFDNVFCAIGVHPLSVSSDVIAHDELAQYVKHPKVVALGETGLDFYRDHEHSANQIPSLEVHIKLAQDHNIPLVIHSRNADTQVIEVLTKHYKQKPFRGAIHCFSATRELAVAMLDIGFYISASGIVTFNKSEDLRNIFKIVPLNKLLIETDAPYLAPMPYRGKTNHPRYIKHTAKHLAKYLNIDFESFCMTTSQNFCTLFDKAGKYITK